MHRRTLSNGQRVTRSHARLQAPQCMPKASEHLAQTKPAASARLSRTESACTSCWGSQQLKHTGSETVNHTWSRVTTHLHDGVRKALVACPGAIAHADPLHCVHSAPLERHRSLRYTTLILGDSHWLTDCKEQLCWRKRKRSSPTTDGNVLQPELTINERRLGGVNLPR